MPLFRDRDYSVDAETAFTDIPLADQYYTACNWRLTKTSSGSHCKISVDVAFKKQIWGATSK